MLCKVSVLLALATSAAAHMRLLTPTPFANDTLNNFPLTPADFPCKRNYQVTAQTQWNAGESKDISFVGTAVHGGGSCQFSLTTDTEPTEASQWKVIHSIVGGCPSNVTGNLEGNDPKQGGAAIFPVTMPDVVPDGKYTFAWTWLNKKGNREFYMDCAPIQVGSGGSADPSALSAFPDMFIANLPSEECSTKEDEDFNYPKPGQSVFEGAGAALGDTYSGAGCAAQAKMAAGNGQAAPPSTPTQPGYGTTPVPSKPAASASAVPEPVSSKPAASASAAPEPVPSKPAATTPAGSYPTGIPSNPDGGIYAPGASPAPVAPAPEAPKPEQPSNETTPTTPNTPASGACTPCTTDGAVVCIGSSQFGLCNRGCAVPQDLAMGMVCANGVVGGKRSVRNFPRAHLHRRHGSGHRLF